MGAFGRIARGVTAGVAGTLAMDLLWWSRYRRGGGVDGFPDWELATSVRSFEQASAPGQVGRRLAALVGVELPDELAGTTTNLVHWLTGAAYGAGHGLVRDGRHPVRAGLATGVGAFAASYGTLGAIGVYEPIWSYEADVLAQDLSAHLVFGAVTGIVHGLLARGAPS